MNQDPTVGLRIMMARFALPPGDIYWDGAVHRFSTPDKPRREDGWLMAFPDRRGAIFGDHARGIRVHWMADRSEEPTPADRERWAADREMRREQQEKAQKAAIETVRALWKDAIKSKETVLKHPYLKRKEIDYDVAGQLRVTREAVEFSKGWKLPKGTLLIPMRINRKLVNVQCILADGTKLYWPKAPVIGAAHTVGGEFWKPMENDRRVFITEGWATAWSISKATNRPVVVCFSTGGIFPVTKRFMEKYETAEFIIAADNDRWSVLTQREGWDDIPNPGVHFATQAADRLKKVKYSTPDFRDLTDKPTDYDDLRRQEGEDSVRYWLNPQNARLADTTPPEVKEGDEDEGSDEPAWVDDAPFRCLGYNNRDYYFLDQGGQLMSLPGLGFGSRAMMMLAPKSFWNTHFDSTKGVRWQDAASSVLHYQATRKGVFKPGMIRGRGIWRNEDLEIVPHLGDRLLAPGDRRWMTPEAYRDGDTIYHRLPRLSGPSSTKPMALEDRKRLYEMFASRFWHHDGSGPLLLGWTVLAPFCAALDWRPHIWIIGTKGCGKTKVIELMILPLLGDMVIAGQGRT
ncbi:MAG: toprim domain-containing protein, partial [Gemmatimonadetes bacterium]|nr:toprim domain-containing protein [Gemmatimonadota bacterium]